MLVYISNVKILQFYSPNFNEKQIYSYITRYVPKVMSLYKKAEISLTNKYKLSKIFKIGTVITQKTRKIK